MTRSLAAFILFAALETVWSASLQIDITSKVSDENVQLASLRYGNSAGERFSVTRISYFTSNIALQRSDGSWLEFSNFVAWLDAGQNRNSFRLENIPFGKYRSVRFDVGLNNRLNHSDAAKIPGGSALNPALNDLYWGWQRGYVFLAIEGLWRNSAGQLDGWSYHLARDGNAVCITLPASLDIHGDWHVDIDFDVRRLLNAQRPISFARDGSSTHSREGDPVLAALKCNLAAAFRVRHASAMTENECASAKPSPLYMPKKFAPYPFHMGAAFPMPALPADNPLITERVTLGGKLFSETRLSGDGTISCASCHQEKSAFSDPRRVSAGISGRLGTRHAMPLCNLAWKTSFFWDGRATSLREQALMPIQNHSEMDQDFTNAITGIASMKDYPAAFQAAFGSPEISPEKIGLALEQFLLTLTSFDSKFDRVQRGAEKFTEVEERGFELFSTEFDPRRGQYGADCFHCHGGALFQSQAFANNGLDSDFADMGRAKVTGKESDRGKFAVPSLRNVALTGPYMHDGRFNTLDEAVAHYCIGVKRSPTLDPNLAKHPNGGVPLSPADQRSLVAFLKTLTDPRFTSP